MGQKEQQVGTATRGRAMTYLTATCSACGGLTDSRSKSGRCARCRIYTTRPTIDRVMERIVINTNECWLWTGSQAPSGYGQIRQSVGEGGRLVRTHRVTYSHFVGAIPDGLEIDHLCRVRLCCNPDHLEPVTRTENVHRGDAMLLRKVRPCTICATVFTGRTWAATCSPECRSEAGRRAAHKRWQTR